MSERDFEIDPRVEKEIDSALSESDIIGAGMTSGNNDKIPLVDSFMPGTDEWQGKTRITKKEAKAHALSKNLASAFPEIKPMESFIEDSVNDLEMLYTSVEGQSRTEIVSVLRGVFGARSEEVEEAQSLAYTALAGASKEDD